MALESHFDSNNFFTPLICHCRRNQFDGLVLWNKHQNFLRKHYYFVDDLAIHRFSFDRHRRYCWKENYVRFQCFFFLLFIFDQLFFLAEFVAPTKVSNFTREIPEVAWYRRKEIQFILSGFLPFSAIYIELYYIFESVWGYKTYTLFGILMIVFLILLIVTSCVSITMTYFQLSLEDWQWPWWSFFNGASTGIFIFAYSIFYYLYKSSMTGILQAFFFFGYMFLACYFFFILLGTVSFLASFIFVYHIYGNVKVD